MPRVVRQAPLSARLKAYLDPWDWLLWLAEELNDDSYDEWLKLWATPIGLGLNVVFIVARGASANATPGRAGDNDDVFGDDGSSGTGWFAWSALVSVYLLTALCCLNASYTFFRKRHYRLFQQPVDVAPETPSAHRVRVDSSPATSSPLRYLQNIVSATSAASRAYPDAEREVWELSVWDPKPFNLTLFTLFSPGHLLLYYSLLPPPPLDPRPSVTVLMAIAFGSLLSLQLTFLKTSFSQQAKDSALIHGEVMNEYDTKFVRPVLNHPVRDVGTQTRESAMSPQGTKTREVDVYMPTTIINRGFHVHPNTNYSTLYDPNDFASQPDLSHRSRRSIGLPQSATTPNLLSSTTTSTQTHQGSNFLSSALSPRPSANSASPDFSSPLKPHHERVRERSPQKGDGGNFGIHSSSASPMRKAAAGNAENRRLDRPQSRSTSDLRSPAHPIKRVSASMGFQGESPRFVNGNATRRETGRY